MNERPRLQSRWLLIQLNGSGILELKQFFIVVSMSIPFNERIIFAANIAVGDSNPGSQDLSLKFTYY